MDQAGGPAAVLFRRGLVSGRAAVVEIIQEPDVVRLGDGEILLPDEHRIVVEKWPEQRDRARPGEVF